MAKIKRVRGKSGASGKPSAAELAKAIGKKHRHLAKAVHSALQEAGFKGVRVHSLRLSVPRAAFSGPGCDPPCSGGRSCVLQSDGGVTRWECVP